MLFTKSLNAFKTHIGNEKAKILWYFEIQTNRMVMENLPDIVLVDKEEGSHCGGCAITK